MIQPATTRSPEIIAVPNYPQPKNGRICDEKDGSLRRSVSPHTDRLIKPPAQLTPTQNNVALFSREKKGLFLQSDQFIHRLSELLSSNATEPKPTDAGAQKKWVLPLRRSVT